MNKFDGLITFCEGTNFSIGGCPHCDNTHDELENEVRMLALYIPNRMSTTEHRMCFECRTDFIKKMRDVLDSLEDLK